MHTSWKLPSSLETQSCSIFSSKNGGECDRCELGWKTRLHSAHQASQLLSGVAAAPSTDLPAKDSDSGGPLIRDWNDIVSSYWQSMSMGVYRTYSYVCHDLPARLQSACPTGSDVVLRSRVVLNKGGERVQLLPVLLVGSLEAL